jgi:pre-60S factor REI1
MTLPCNTCSLRFATRAELFVHYKTDLHRTNLIQQSRHEPPLTLEQYAKMKTDEDAPRPQPAAPLHDSDDDCDLGSDIPPEECLFCGKRCDTAALALDHMKCHDFRFCYPARLVDPVGLMQHIAAKVGVARRCPQCNKHCRSVAALRDHMGAKRHCGYELTDEDDQFYSPEGLPATAIVDGVGELHVNGKVYGHRMYRRYYGQRLAVPEELAGMAGMPAVQTVQTVPPDRNAAAWKAEASRLKDTAKRESGRVSRAYHALADMHRGNA